MLTAKETFAQLFFSGFQVDMRYVPLKWTCGQTERENENPLQSGNLCSVAVSFFEKFSHSTSQIRRCREENTMATISKRHLLLASLLISQSQSLQNPSWQRKSSSRNVANSVAAAVDAPMIALQKQIVSDGRKGRTDQALKLYKSIPAPSVRVWNSAIDACARARPTRIEKAFDLLHEGIATKGLTPNVFTFGAIMSACARAKHVQKALDVLGSMEVRWGRNVR